MSPSLRCTDCGFISDRDASLSTCPRCGQPAPAQHTTLSLVDGVSNQSTLTITSSAPSEPEALKVVGRFLISSFLGEGGFGEVYRAHDPQLDRHIALKLAKTEMVNSANRVARFLREARAAANLRHPNIVPVFDAGNEGNRYYIAAALISGHTLEAELREGIPEFSRTAELVCQLADALAYSHGQGIVHRDVKPSNIMIDERGDALLMDFGLAAMTDAEEKLTQDGQGMGTPAYMAPEQAQGHAVPASDQYSLGCVLYELLTARTIFDGPPALQIFLHQAEVPRPPRTINRRTPKDLETICLKCLEKDCSQRYQNMHLLVEDLRRYLRGDLILARPIGPAEKAFRWCKRNPAIAGLLLLVAMLLIAGTTVSTLFAVDANTKSGLAQLATNRAKDSAKTATQQRDRATKLAEKLGQSLDELQKQTELTQAELKRVRFLNYSLRIRDAARSIEEGRLVDAEVDLMLCDSKSRAWEYGYLLQKTRPRLRELAGQVGAVQSLACSPEGDWIATGSNDGTLTIWRSANESPVHILRQHHGEVASLAFDTRGKQVASGDENGQVRVCEAATGKTLHSIKAHSKHVVALVFLANDQKLASVGGDQVIRLWELSTGSLIREFGGPSVLPVTEVPSSFFKDRFFSHKFQPDFTCVAISSTGDLLAAGSGFNNSAKPGQIFLWNLSSGALVQKLTHKFEARSLAFSDDGIVLNSASSDGVECWDHKTGKVLATFKLNESNLAQMAFSLDGRRLAVANQQGITSIWDIKIQQRLLTFSTDRGRLSALALTGDGKGLVTGTNKILKIWRTDEHRNPLSTIATSVAFSPNGDYLAATTGTERPVHLWHRRTTKAAPLHLEDRDWRSVVFAPDSRMLVLGGGTGKILVMDLESRRVVRTLAGHRGPVYGLSFSSDGKKLASAGIDRTIGLWEWPSGKSLRFLSGHERAVKAAVFSTNGRLLVSGSDDQTVRVWDVHTGKQLMNLEGHTAPVNDVAVSEMWIASAGFDRSIMLWNLETGKLRTRLVGHAKGVWSVEFTPDGRRLVSGGGDLNSKTTGEVKIWDVETGIEALSLKGHEGTVWSVAIDHAGRSIVAGGSGPTMTEWKSYAGREKILAGHEDKVRAVACSPDGTCIVSGDESGSVKVWDMERGTELRSFTGAPGKISAVDFAMNGASILDAVGDRNWPTSIGELKIRDACGGAELFNFKNPVCPVLGAAYSDVAKFFVSGHADGSVRIWDLQGKRQTLSGHSGSVNSVALSSDGARIASAGSDATVRIWDPQAAKQLHVLRAHKGKIVSVAFSPDGRRVASAGDRVPDGGPVSAGDRVIAIWDAITGEHLQDIYGHRHAINSIAWSPDGHFLTSGSDDETVRLWDAKNGEQLLVLTGHFSGVASVVFDSAGRRLISGGHDQTVRIWDLETEKTKIPGTRVYP